MRILGPAAAWYVPTAQALAAELAAMPSRFAGPPGLGAGARLHVRPFQRAMKVAGAGVPPAAQARVAESAVTACRPALRRGARACRHTLPFQCSIRAAPPTPASTSEVPTAHAFDGETAA